MLIFLEMFFSLKKKIRKGKILKEIFKMVVLKLLIVLSIVLYINVIGYNLKCLYI